MGQVQLKIEDLFKSVDEATKSCVELRDRLDLVLSVENPLEVACTAIDPPEDLVSLANTLGSVVTDVNKLNRLIVNTLDRLEI